MQIVRIGLYIFFFLPSLCQTYDSLVKQALDAYHNNHLQESMNYYEQAFKVQKSNKHHLYNAAIVASESNQKEKSFEYLNLCLENGWDDPVAIVQNGGFKYLHQFSEWQNKFGEIEKQIDQHLQKILLKIHDNDQRSINNWYKCLYETPSNIIKIDSLKYLRDSTLETHIKIISSMLDTLGFVSFYKVGKKASEVPFLVVQHANLEVQKKYYPLFFEASQKGEFAKRLLALLEDRILVAEKKEQWYGSQLFFNAEDSKYYFYPILDVNHIDKRRQAMGMKSIAEYASESGIVWSIDNYLMGLKVSKNQLKK